MIHSKDGKAEGSFNIRAAEPTQTTKPVPKTGDSANPALWLGMALIGMIGIIGLVLAGMKKSLRKK